MLTAAIWIGGFLFMTALAWFCCMVLFGGRVYDTEDRRGHDE